MTAPAGAAGPADLPSQRLVKTEAGHAEITQRRFTLGRPARNLLLIIDGRRSAGEWLSMVRGCSEDDLYQLLTSGLVATALAQPAAPPLPATAAAIDEPPADTVPGAHVATARMSLADALQMQGYRLLYDRLTAEARPQLGLIKGYRIILDIERCAGPEQIRKLALQFVEQVRSVHGDVKARALAQRLADPP